MFAHQTKAIETIRAMRGPDEGELLVELVHPVEGAWLYAPQDAIFTVLDNPRIEFKPVERWRLN